MNLLIDKVPKGGLAGLKAHWKDDLLSGFMVSLIALPLCLGIALASGVPPMAGLLTAIVGGLLMSRITGSHVTISGPAAGLIVVTLSAVESLGEGDPLAGYQYALAVIVVAGIIQVILGFLKVGKFGDFFPAAAVHGMLAAIGVIIVVKQLFVALGTKAEGKELYEVIGEIPHALVNMNPEIALIAMVSMFILVGHSKVNFKPIKIIPAPMWVILVSIPMAHMFDLFHEHHYRLVGIDYILGPKYLVHLPESVMDGIIFPDFGKIGAGAFWIAVLSISLVSSIESLLSASAVDTLDPYKRKSDLNRDMSAMGGGSALSGLVGGLPMISEIVRSSANISNGGKTQWANFFHGGFLLIFLIFGKPIIEQIPLAALAAMLIHVGFRLASPREFKHTLEIGKSEFIIFLTTLIVVLATDLILGIVAGIVMNFIIHLISGAPIKYMFKTKLEYEEANQASGIIKLQHSGVFSNYISVKKEILSHSDKKSLVIDFQNVNLIDHTFRTHLYELQKEWDKLGRNLTFVNEDHLIPVSDHPLATLRASKDVIESKELVLSEHQQLLAEIAEKSNMFYTPSKTMSFKDFDGFSFIKSGRIEYAQNLITGVFEEIRFLYSEIIYDLTLDTKSADSILPALILKKESGKKPFPIFTLELESLYDKVNDLAIGQDIDFENHPIFSDRFLLRGPDESAVREFFNPVILSFIETYLAYHIESNGKSLIVYRFDGKMGKEETTSLIKFGKQLALQLD
ncbi:MAG: SulP family inorganic anion transporter [Cyclobacteriaceae bacterium]